MKVYPGGTVSGARPLILRWFSVGVCGEAKMDLRGSGAGSVQWQHGPESRLGQTAAVIDASPRRGFQSRRRPGIRQRPRLTSRRPR